MLAGCRFAILLIFILASGHAQAADPTFTNVESLNGLAYSGPSQGDQPVFPYLDSIALAQSRHGGAWPILMRQGSSFVQVATAIPAKEDGHGCSAADVTNPSMTGRDGLVDLICTSGACHGTCTREYRKFLFVQQTDGGFMNLASSTPMLQPRARGRDTAVSELPDGRQVVIFANENSSQYPSESIDRAYLQSGGRFTELPLLAATGTARADTGGFCAATLPRGAKMPDLLFCDDARVNIYRWDGSNYRLTHPFGNFFARDLLVADVDGNGSQDIVTVNAKKLSVRRWGTVDVTLATLSRGFALARGDMDCDGQPDILVVQNGEAGNDHVMLLNNGGGLSYRRVPFPHPSTGSGDSATYVANWDGAGHPAMLVSHGHFTSGRTFFVQASCTR
jgi:hypothetical protein